MTNTSNPLAKDSDTINNNNSGWIQIYVGAEQCHKFCVINIALMSPTYSMSLCEQRGFQIRLVSERTHHAWICIYLNGKSFTVSMITTEPKKKNKIKLICKVNQHHNNCLIKRFLYLKPGFTQLTMRLLTD